MAAMEIRMRVQIIKVFLTFVIVGVFHAHSSTLGGSDPTVSPDQLAKRVFDAEEITIAAFAKERPILETYLQSLYPDTSAEAPIDDAYFLGRIEVNPDSSGRGISQSLLFGDARDERQIRVVNGQHWSLMPDGLAEMLFPDLRNFYDDAYDLKVQGSERLGTIDCIRLSVNPKDTRKSGYFVGDIWVETAKFHIIRAQGTFTPKHLGFFRKYFDFRGITYIGLYLRFDAWREQVAPGVWLPSYTSFEESERWTNKTGGLVCSFHYRGYLATWGYENPLSYAARADADQLSRSPESYLGPLERQHVLARPGEVEASLNEIIRELRRVNNLPGRDVPCRILLTTPVELFSVHRTILISRGLLNLIPSRSVLTVLLASELAHIVLGHSDQVQLGDADLWVRRWKYSDFRGFGIRRSTAERAAAASEVRILLNHLEFRNAIPEANAFLSQLALQSSQIPNLVRARFGPALMKGSKSLVELPTGPFDAQPMTSPLALHETYRTLSSFDRIAKWGNDIRIEQLAR